MESDAGDPEAAAVLIAAAQAAYTSAYAPYSRFRIGAAVHAGGRVFRGCNIENASYGLTVCAERVAVFAAVAAGQRTIDAVAIVTEAPAPTTPCGACRQVLHEFGPTMRVIMHADGQTVTSTLDQLLPLAFGPEALADGR